MGEEAYDQSKHEGLARYVCNGLKSRRKISSGDYDDALQVARIAIWKASQTWKADHPAGLSWGTYAGYLARVAVRNWASVSNRNGFSRTTAWPQTCEITEPIEPETAESTIEEVSRREKVELIRAAVKELPDTYRAVCEMILSGMSRGEIASRMKTTKQNIHKKLIQCREFMSDI
jgi:RNA polymerase sigma factor (sigma-70 family)